MNSLSKIRRLENKKNPVLGLQKDGLMDAGSEKQLREITKQNQLIPTDFSPDPSRKRFAIAVDDKTYFLEGTDSRDVIADSALKVPSDDIEGAVNADTLVSQAPAYYLNRANHTGSYDMGFIRGNGSVVPPVASTVYWLGHNLSTASGVGKMFNPVASVIDSVCFQMTYFGTPTTQTFDIKISVNAVETSLSTTMFLTGGGGASITHNVTGLNLAISANTFYVYKVTMPAWTTAPTQLYVAHITHFKS